MVLYNQMGSVPDCCELDGEFRWDMDDLDSEEPRHCDGHDAGVLGRWVGTDILSIVPRDGVDH